MMRTNRLKRMNQNTDHDHKWLDRPRYEEIWNDLESQTTKYVCVVNWKSNNDELGAESRMLDLTKVSWETYAFGLGCKRSCSEHNAFHVRMFDYSFTSVC